LGVAVAARDPDRAEAVGLPVVVDVAQLAVEHDVGGLSDEGPDSRFVASDCPRHQGNSRSGPTVGRDTQSPVTADYDLPGDAAFTGTIKWVEMEAGDDSHDHLLDPADVFNYVMARH
jgi:hypothetical protein